MSKQLRLDVAQLTDVGLKRPHNEDNMAYVIPKDEQVMTKKGALFIVADGMGGHAAGEVASEIAVETVSVAYYQEESEDIAVSLMNTIKRANAIIHQRAAENMSRSGMGTTCVSAVLRGDMAYIANVGDSRAYIVHQGAVQQISQDHSWVEEQVRAGLLTREQSRSHAQRNVITRCLGTQTDVEVDVFPVQLTEGDALILCTDGLSGLVGEEELGSIVEQYQPQESVYHLVGRANANGGSDNITAIVVRVQEVGIAEPPPTRHLVPVGAAPEDEDTAVIKPVPSSRPGLPGRVDSNLASVTAPVRAVSGPLFTTNNKPAARAAIAPTRRKRSRLLYPTLAVLIILVVAVCGGGLYYYLHLRADITQKFDHANSLINQANPDKPVEALQQLAQAQNDLRAVQSSLLLGSQPTQLNQLQSTLTARATHAITAYNTQNHIVTLPCTGDVSTSAALMVPLGVQVQADTLTTIQDQQNFYSYVLGSDANIYQLTDQHSLVRLPAFSSNTGQILLLAGNTQNVFALTSQGNSPPSYTLHVLKPGANGALAEDNAHTIGNQFVPNVQRPQALAVWNNDIYLFFPTTTPNQALILNMTKDNLNGDPQHKLLSISANLLSAAAFGNKQLFLLFDNGSVQSLMMDDNPATNPQVVTLPTSIVTPLNIDPQNVVWNTPSVPPTVQAQQATPQTAFLNITGASMLTAGNLNGAPNLLVVDNANHRIIQLKYSPAANSASSGSNAQGGGTVNAPLQFVQQYVSSANLFVAVKGSTVDLRGTGTALSILNQPGRNAFNVITLDTARTCAATP